VWTGTTTDEAGSGAPLPSEKRRRPFPAGFTQYCGSVLLDLSRFSRGDRREGKNLRGASDLCSGSGEITPCLRTRASFVGRLPPSWPSGHGRSLTGAGPILRERWVVAAAREFLRGFKRLTRAGHVDPLQSVFRDVERDGQAVLASRTLVSGSVGFTPPASDSAGSSFGWSAGCVAKLGRLRSSDCLLCGTRRQFRERVVFGRYR
jgi:hypothetical protein